MTCTNRLTVLVLALLVVLTTTGTTGGGYASRSESNSESSSESNSDSNSESNSESMYDLGSAAQTDRDERVAWWREARFGLFIHWGLYAIPAGQWGEETGHAEWIRTTAEIPLDQYDRFVDQFNPVRFDADAWVRMAKRAGMKYIVITSKHHDGFCLFDSEHTDFDIMSTPFKRDIMKELSEACRRHGLKMCWYHSIMDWHHPDYLPRRGWETTRSSEGADFDRFVRYLHGQVTELLTNYGDIGVMWFDGEWEGTWNHEYGQPLYDLCRRLQPDVIVNNRVDKGRGGMAGMTADARYAGDFGTPEQEIPATGLPGVDWETCMTMNQHWGYNKNDFDYKSTEDLIRKLVDIASKGGNFLLNVGPTAEGEFPPESIERLEAIGAWMDVNGESIYGTGASPFSRLLWGRCTVKEDGGRTKMYLHVFDWPADGRLILAGIGNRVERAYLLAEPHVEVEVIRQESDLHFTLPPDPPDKICSVVVLEVEGRPIVYEPPTIEAASSILVRPLRVELKTGSAALILRYTLDGTVPTGRSPAYLEPLTISSTTVVRARAFHNGKPVSGISEATFTRVEPAPAERVGGLVQGVTIETYHGDWSMLPDFGSMKPDSSATVANFQLRRGPRMEYIAHRYSAYLAVPRDDAYVFSLTSDDGSRLLIGDKVVVNNDGLHGVEEQRGTVALAAGTHRITVEWFNKTGGAELDVMFAPVTRPLARIADSSLFVAEKSVR